MTYLISDLHGYDPVRLAKLLKSAEITADDSIYVLGDVIDRGTYGLELLSWVSKIAQAEVFEEYIERRKLIRRESDGTLTVLDREGYDLVKWLMTVKVKGFILGNHEDMMLESEAMFAEITEDTVSQISDRDSAAWARWMINGGDVTVSAIKRFARGKKERVEYVWRMLDYIEDLPLYLEIEAGGRKYLLVHAGLGDYSCEKKLEEYTLHDLIWKRPRIDTVYEGDRTVVFGHTPTLYLSRAPQHYGKVIKGRGWLCIDTGAAAGLAPALVCLEEGKVYYGEKHEDI